LALEVDPALAEMEGVEGLPDEDFSISGNKVRALWFNGASKHFLPGEVLFSLKIKILRPANLSQILSFSNKKLVAEAYVASGNGAESRRPLNLKFGASKNEVAFFPPRPNPFFGATTLGLLLSQPGEVCLEVFDVSGKTVFENDLEAGAGYRSLLILASDLPGEGLFFYRVQAGGEVFSGTFVAL